MAQDKVERERRGEAKKDRDAGGFLALPTVVIESPGYRQAGHVARSLLIDIAKQVRAKNNGKLTASAKYLKPLGWRSNDVITCALKDLQACGLIVETRRGAINRPSWYALTWRDLAVKQGLDIDASRFLARGAYMRPSPLPARPSHKRKPPSENASPTPPGGAVEGSIAPPGGAGGPAVAPPGGAMRADLAG